jgi:hypothetical protein
MSMDTYLEGRLRNTPLPRSHGLLPLFEAVVNAIHAIDELAGADESVGRGEVVVEIARAPQAALPLDAGNDMQRRGTSPFEHIVGFKVTDNGAGFTNANMLSFETLDSGHKARVGCRGVGRLLWLKAFEHVRVSSDFQDAGDGLLRRSFAFTAGAGINDMAVLASPAGATRGASVVLDGFRPAYRDKAAKSARTIAGSLLEHCLWYFVRRGGAPAIRISDGTETVSLDQVYDETMFSQATKENIVIRGLDFELTHLKLSATSCKHHSIAWCAGSRVVEEENLAGKIPGLHGKIHEHGGDFIYACYVSSPFLDENVRPERIGFDIGQTADDLFSGNEPSFPEIRAAVALASARHLESFLASGKMASHERVDRFVSQRAPRYRPILRRIAEDKLYVNPDITDKELDLLLHKQLSDIEGALICEGHEVMEFGANESPEEYRVRLSSYLEKADDIKKSDLASYVFHRKVILDIFEKAIQRGSDGKYVREELIHQLIMPMRTTSNEQGRDGFNLWLVDERLAFHDFLASDKSLASMPITDCMDARKPDICALNVSTSRSWWRTDSACRWPRSSSSRSSARCGTTRRLAWTVIRWSRRWIISNAFAMGVREPRAAGRFRARRIFRGFAT